MNLPAGNGIEKMAVAETSPDALVAEGISKRFSSLTAVDHLDLRIRQGSLFGLLGPNGAGKTTTLRMILHMLVPDEGTLRLFGQPLTGRVQDWIGYLPEDRGLYPRMKVLDVLVFLAGLKGVAAQEASARAHSWLNRLGIGEWSDRKVVDLSKGMQQKVQFIAAVLHEPRLLILDEPFAGLDPVNAAEIKNIMLSLRARGSTIILSSHRMEQVEMMCDAICLIHGGHKVLGGDLQEIKRQHGKNTLRVEYSGDSSFLDQPAWIEKVDYFGAVAEARLRPGADPQQILRCAVERGVRIYRFELVEPSLNEIFIERVSNSHA